MRVWIGGRWYEEDPPFTVDESYLGALPQRAYLDCPDCKSSNTTYTVEAKRHWICQDCGFKWCPDDIFQAMKGGEGDP